jgi:hypothetical protein
MAKWLFLSLILFLSLNGFSQPLPVFKLLRYEEDFSSFNKDSNAGWYEKTKFTPLSKDRSNYLSFGGDIRYQYSWFKNEDWGEAPKDKNGFVLTRYLVHADLHAGNHFRTFIQLQSSLANGKEKHSSPVDENQLDLHQAFFDVAIPLDSKHMLTARVGRQELLYGSQRLIAVRDGPNNRQSFDAARLVYSVQRFKADVFFSHYVRSRQQIFDDGFNKNTKLWGLYTTSNKIPFLQHLDLYYLGLWKRAATFDDGSGKELRHSLGSRLWGFKNGLRYDIEGLWQFGKFQDKKIAAWTFSINTGYKFNKIKLSPEVGIKTEWISGDALYGDSKLQTFNPLFPRGGYFGLVSLIGPANLFDIHPMISFDLSKKLLLNMDCDIFWRYSRNDGIYGPNAALIYSGKNSGRKFIGRQFSTDIVYTPNPFLYFRGEFTWFKAGGFLKDVGTGNNILFSAATVQLKF